MPSMPALAEGFLSASGVLQLQEAMGNAATSRLLGGRRGLARAPLMRDGGVPSGQEYDDARDARKSWVDGGMRGPENYRASTGRGGFKVSYDPSGQELLIELNGAVDFQDGIELYLGVFAVANQPTAPVQAAATAINRLPFHDRAAAVAPWGWNGTDKTTFMNDFQTQVQGAWSAQYDFHCTKHYWDDLGAKVRVSVNVHDGDKGDDDHMKLTTYKIAPGGSAGTVGVVNSGSAGFFDDGSTNNTMTLNSTDVSARGDIMLTRQASFDSGATTMDAPNTAIVQTFGSKYKSGGGPRCGTCGQEIAGLAGTVVHARIQGSGADPEAQAQQRLTTVTAALTAGGMTTAPQFEYAGTGDQVTLVVGSGVQQVIAAHEAGHMFGLGDEYTTPFSGTGKAPGSPIDGNIGPSQGLPGAVAENTDSIMSVGAAVKPQHYATFLEALKHISAMQEWAIGPAQAVLPPGVDGPDQPRNQGPPGGGGQPAEPTTAVA
jgi:hypothetical protein